VAGIAKRFAGGFNVKDYWLRADLDIQIAEG
jgi:hypothetical protein